MALRRTNRTGALLAFTVTGSRMAAVTFGDSFQENLEAYTVVPGLFAYRIYPEGDQLSEAPWITRVASGRVVLATNLDPAEAHTIEIRVMRLAGAVTTQRTAPSNIERWREPEEGLADQITDPSGGFGPSGQFFEIEDIDVHSGGSISAVTWTSLPNSLDVLVLGDGMMDGIVVDNMWEGRDDLGPVHSYVWQGIVNIARTANPSLRPNIWNLSFDQAHFSHLRFPLELQSGVIVASLANYKQGIGVRVSDAATVELDPRQDYPGHVESLYDKWTSARPHGATPDLVVIALGRQDQLIQDPSSTTWEADAASDFQDLLEALYADYAAPILVVTPHTEGIENAAHQDTVVQAMLTGVADAVTGGIPGNAISVVSLAEIRDSLEG